MPPKAKITREMVVNAAFEIARSDGADNISARTVSEKLNCSTQPVMYHFKTIEELKKAVCQKANDFHTEYIMNIVSDDPMKDIGMNYIRFAATERKLFRMLFQSDTLPEGSITELTSSENVAPMLSVLAEEAEIGMEQAEQVFFTLALFVHGYASLLANNSLEFDQIKITKQLENVLEGALYAAKEGEEHE